MAADHRREGLNGTVGDFGLRDKSRGKKQVGSLESNGFRVKPHVSLEWDANRKRVIAKREQIGLSWRNLRRFSEPVSDGHKILADAFDVPAELFKLDCLDEVLSYEVWQTCLSEKERRFLSQFLPAETEPQQAVKQLLAGANLNFGNPFVDWSTSLQSGNLHPDAVVHREKSLKAEKSAYYLELHRYHNNMIGSLLKIKERWQSSGDLEKEFTQKAMRSRKEKEKKFSCINRSEYRDLDDSFASTSKSSSLAGEEKTSNSDEQIESYKKAGGSRKRISKKRPVKDGNGNITAASDDVLVDDAKARKGLRLKKRNIVYNDGTKYMSYVKISKKQHELAKSMEKSGSSMQSRSLSNFANLHIQPYEVFVEEQRKKLHDHWLRLANHDLPSAYGIWNDIRSQRQQIMKSLEQELLERHDTLMEDHSEEIPESETPAEAANGGIDERLTMEEDKESPSCSSPDQEDNRQTDYASSEEDDEQSMVPGFMNDQRGENGEEVVNRFVTEDCNESVPCSPQEAMMDPVGVIIHNSDANSVPGSSHDSFLNQATSSSSGNPNRHFNHLIEPETEIMKPGPSPHDVSVSAYPGNLNGGGDLIDMDRIPLSQGGGDMWQPVSSVSSIPLTYFDSSSSGCQFNSVPEIPPLPDTIEGGEQQAPSWVDLQPDMHREAQHLQRDPNSFISSSYTNHHRDQNELLQSIFNGQQGILHPGSSNSNQQKHMGPLNYQLPNSVLAESYSHRMQNNIQQNMSVANMLPSGGSSGFLMQRRQQEHHHMLPTSSVSINSWPHHVTSSIQHPSALSGSSWFSHSNEHQVRVGGWFNSYVGPSQTNSLVVEQSMYDVLPSRPLSYDSPIHEFIPSRNYGQGLMSGHGIGNILPHHHIGPTSMDYMNRRDEDTGWMGLPPQQNSGMNDSMGKPPFLGSWNT